MGVRGSAACPLFTTPLFQNMWPCVRLLSAERGAPCRRGLAIDGPGPLASAARWRGSGRTDLPCRAAGRRPRVRWAACAAWHWGSGPHSGGGGDFDGMDMWNAPVVQSRQPLTYRLMESVGLGGPK